MSGLIYLASPYSSHDPVMVEERFEAVCREAAVLMAAGHFIYSPIAHTHPIAVRGELPTDWAYWGAHDEAIISKCSALWVLMLGGWQESRGVAAEIAIAERLGIAVSYRPPLANRSPNEWGRSAPAGAVNAADGAVEERS